MRKIVLLTTAELAARWSMSAGTLRNWRSAGKGPKWINLGPRGRGRKPAVRYKLVTVEHYEKRNGHG